MTRTAPSAFAESASKSASATTPLLATARSNKHLADASLGRRCDGYVAARLLEVSVELAVGRDAVEIEQPAAEEVAEPL